MNFSRLPLKRMGEIALGKMLQPEPKRTTDVAAPYLRAAHVQPGGRIVDAEEKTMWFDPAELSRHDLKRGDVVIVEGGAGYGRSAVVEKDMPGWGFQNSIVRVRAIAGRADGRFLAYALQAALDAGEIEVVCFTATIPHFTAEKVGSFAVPGPTVSEQTAIADYLDRETATMDTLIGKQLRLIESLRERRASLISHAVLESTAVRVPLRRVVDVIDCAHVTAEFVSGDTRFPVASIRECGGANVDLSACNYTTREFFEHLRASNRTPRVGDLLFTRNVSVGLVSAVAPGTPEFAVGQETVLLRRRNKINPAFLRYALIGAEAQFAIEGAMMGSTFRRVNVSAIRALPIPVPAIDAQARIVAELDAASMKIDKLIAKAERFIELTKERRAALIAAAVAGGVDVRGEVA